MKILLCVALYVILCAAAWKLPLRNYFVAVLAGIALYAVGGMQ